MIEKEKEKERKLYKGEIKKVEELEIKEPTPIQPKERVYKTPAGWTQSLPPTFIVTRFSTSPFGSGKRMNFFDPKSNVLSVVDVPNDLELNVLSGSRAEELKADWEKLKTTRLSAISPRLSCTIGTDPEIFVVKEKNPTEIVPAWTFLGSKKNPGHYGGGTSARGTVYWDGFQAEFTTPGNLTCLMQVAGAIRLGLKAIRESKPAGSRLSIASVLPAEPKILATAKEEHVAFGCAPSKNVYGIRGSVESGRMTPYRFAGGHIHFGLTEKTRIPQMVRALDTVLGVACVSLFASFDSKVRRHYYGQAGEYRTPDHGLEYRVLSNAWLSHPIVFHMVFDLARAVAGVVANGFDISDFWSVKEEETVAAIMESDVDKARAILHRNEGPFRQIMRAGSESYGIPLAWESWIRGMEYLVANPQDVEGNWRLHSDSAWYSHPHAVFAHAKKGC